MSLHHLSTPIAFSCYVFTTDGRLLLTMRGPAKETWSGVWANSCHGQPAPGESLRDAVIRVLHDELGLVDVDPELILPRFRYEAGEVDVLCPVYRVVTDDAPRPNPAEVGDFEWVGWPDFVYAVATGDIAVSPWCRPQVAELGVLGVDPSRWPVARAAA